MGEGQCRKATKLRSRRVDGELRCERCGAYGLCPGGKLITLHHRRKRSHLPKHRLWEPGNCVWLCGDGVTGCHGWVESHPFEAREDGWHVWSHEEPRAVPVRMWHTDRPLYLDDEGYWAFDPPDTQGDNG